MEKQEFLKERAKILRALEGKSFDDVLKLCGSALNEHLAGTMLIVTVKVQPVSNAFALDDGAERFYKNLADAASKYSA